MSYSRWCCDSECLLIINFLNLSRKVSYIAWLEHQLNVLKRTDIDEHIGAEYLLEIRKKVKWNKGQSFATISSVGKNAAIVHYHPEAGKSAIINNSEIYLLDSGGQYLYYQFNHSIKNIS